MEKKCSGVNVSRRQFSASLLLGSTMASSCNTQLGSPPVPTDQVKQPTINKPGYIKLPSPIPIKLVYADDDRPSSDEVEVVQFFMWYCSYCYNFNKLMTDWTTENRSRINYRREIPALTPDWVYQARAYYALQYLNRADSLIEPLFEKVAAERRFSGKAEGLLASIKKLDPTVDIPELEKVMKSFAVEGQLKRTERLGVLSGLTGVPSVLVGRQYLVSPKISGSNEGMISAIDDLVNAS